MGLEHLVLAGHLYAWRQTCTRLESLRRYFDEWQEQGYATRPGWYDEYIDKRINDLTNVDLLELLDTVYPLHLQDN